MLVDATQTFSAVAAAQDGSIVPVEFTFEIDDPILASVEDAGPNTVTVTGLRRGDTKIIVKSADRGIKIELAFSVHNEVKGIVITPATVDAVESGDEIDLMATAYDKASGDDKTTNDGNSVPGVTFTWTTSNASVATVDAEDNMSPTIKTHGAGSAKIQALVGDVKSNEVTINVFGVEAPDRRLVAVNQPYEADFTAAVIDEEDGTVTTAASITPTTFNISANLQEYRFVAGTTDNPVNEFRWVNIAGSITFESLDDSFLILAEDVSGTATATNDISGAATDQAPASIAVTLAARDNMNALAATHLVSGAAVVTGPGSGLVKITATFADPIYVRVTIDDE